MRTLLLIAVVALIVAPAADAKSCARVGVVPSQPTAGAPAEIRLTTWLPSWAGARFRLGEHLALHPGYRLEVSISAPPSSPYLRPLRLRLLQNPQRRWLWKVRFAFPVVGLWTVSPDQRLWAGAPPICAPPRRVTVR